MRPIGVVLGVGALSLAMVQSGVAATGAQPERLPSLVQGVAARSGAPVGFERVGDELRPVLARAALADAMRAWRASDRRVDLRTFGDLTRAAIHTATGTHVQERPEVSTTDAPIHIAFHAGDLTGDGLDDVLDYVLQDDTVELVARRGTDGSELWSVAVTGVDQIVIPFGDGTGDGAADVLILDLHADGGAGTGDCVALTACYAALGESYRWTLALHSGPTGAAVWTQTYDAVVAAAEGLVFTDPLFAAAFGAVATNAIVAPLPSGDHDGDGRQDLVVDALDLALPLAFGSLFTEHVSGAALSAPVVSATRASVVSGHSGTSLFAKASAGPGVALLEPVPDITGSATTDLVWDVDVVLAPGAACVWPAADDGVCADASARRRTVDLIDGSTFLTAWTRELDGPGWILPVGGDADGDAVADLMFISFAGGVQTALLSGTDGTELWRSADIVLGPAGMVDGVPIVATAEIPQAFETIDFEIRRRDGRDGAVLAATQHHVEIPTDWWEVFIFGEYWLLPDADGDGDADVLAQVTVEAREISGHLWVERGKDTTQILTREGVGAPYAIGVEDMNGDGTNDLLDIAQVVHRTSFDITFSGVTLPAAQTSWSIERRIFREGFGSLDVTADLTGAGGSDALLSWVQFPPDGPREAMVEAYEQSDGSVAWSLGTPLTAPPAPDTGGIAGTLTAQGAPSFGLCAIAASPDGVDIDLTFPSGDGRYLLAELPDGVYAVRFADCFFGGYVEEWYDDVPDIGSATLVTVAGGAITTGVDADLAAP